MTTPTSTSIYNSLSATPSYIFGGLSDADTITARNAKCQSCEHLDLAAQRCKLCGCYTLTRPISTGTSRTDVYLLTVDGTLTASASVYWAQTCTPVCLGAWEGVCIVYSTCP